MVKTLCILMVLLRLSLSDAAAESATPIYYAGFNYFVGDGGEKEAQVFTDYIKAVVPIMSRFDMTLESYRVVSGQMDALPAHAITIGVAPNQERFEAFFADQKFQALFPSLVSIIQQHTVVFTPSALVLRDKSTDCDILFSVGWERGSGDHRSDFPALDAKNHEISKPYGLRLLARSEGVVANTGLAGEIEAVTPPDYVDLWCIKDPHSLFDDSPSKNGSDRAQQRTVRGAVYWLRLWE